MLMALKDSFQDSQLMPSHELQCLQGAGQRTPDGHFECHQRSRCPSDNCIIKFIQVSQVPNLPVLIDRFQRND